MTSATSTSGDPPQKSTDVYDASREPGRAFLRQYELAVHLFDRELSRFWIRFYVFLGLECVLVPVTYVALERLPLGVARTVVLFGVVLSATLTWIIYRGLGMQKLMLRVGWEFEERSKGTLQLLHVTRELSPSPLWFSRLLSVLVLAAFILLWLALGLHLERST